MVTKSMKILHIWWTWVWDRGLCPPCWCYMITAAWCICRHTAGIWSVSESLGYNSCLQAWPGCHGEENSVILLPRIKPQFLGLPAHSLITIEPSCVSWYQTPVIQPIASFCTLWVLVQRYVHIIVYYDLMLFGQRKMKYCLRMGQLVFLSRCFS